MGAAENHDPHSKSYKQKKAVHKDAFETWVSINPGTAEIVPQSLSGFWKNEALVDIICKYLLDCANGGMTPRRRNGTKIAKPKTFFYAS